MGTDHVPLRLSEHSRVLLHSGMPWDMYKSRASYLFPALISDLVSAAGVSYRAGDTKAMLPRDDQYVPNGKYIRPPPAATSHPTEPVEDIPSSTPQAPTTDQLLHQILERLDR